MYKRNINMQHTNTITYVCPLLQLGSTAVELKTFQLKTKGRHGKSHNLKGESHFFQKFENLNVEIPQFSLKFY